MSPEKGYDNTVMALLEAIRTNEVQVMDLTHDIDEHSPYWPEGRDRSPFTVKVSATFDSRGCFARDVTLSEHFGTHLDAPAHVLPGGLTVDNLPVVSFLSAVCVVDVRENVQANADYSISAADLERHSKTYGPVPFGCLVFFCTGWAKRWPSQEKYIHKDMKGMKHFPGVSEEATRYLLDQVCPTGVGIDTPSVEGGMGKDFDVHRLLLGGGVYILENVGNLERLPPRGAAALTLPLKLAGGSGSPARVLALIPNSRDHP